MKKSEILKIYKDKVKELKKHNFLYFNKDNPKISDAEYDKLKEELIKLEESNSSLKKLKLLQNIVGSYGFALILKNISYLFVDGRYTLQAKAQSGKLFNIITFPHKMPNDILKDKKLTIGFDPKLFTNQSKNIFFNNKNYKFKPLKGNLIDKIWKRKIRKNIKKFYLMPKNSIGDNYKSKITKIISYLKKNNLDYQFITASENCAWLLNIRGGDSKYTPIPHCYILIKKNKSIKLFCDLKKISLAFKNNFKEIKFLDISKTVKILEKIKKKSFIIDKNTCSVYFENLILKNNKIFDHQDPIYSFKMIKNQKEINNIKKAHVQDGVALTRYLFWLKKNLGKKTITEISASQKLLSFRKKNRNFKTLSFPTISGTGPNGAIIHYKATKKSNRTIKKGDIYLVDSGGQYKFGTTDVTRTISFENSNKKIKNIFTRVLKGHIAVADYKLKKNTTGSNIDKEARKFLKQINLDYSHGTGHGVGYFLNVHEGPISISKNNKINLQDGMVLSNEPGYYEKDKFGIRIENLVYVKKDKNKRMFDNLTLVPIEKDLLDLSLLSKKEKMWINNYHKKVLINLSSAMNKKEIVLLKKACSAI